MGRTGSYRLQHSQNFIRNPALVEKLVGRADIEDDDLVVEFGAGTGIVTSALAKQAGQVIAIEQDARLVGKLSDRFQDDRTVCVFGSDALQFPMPHTSFKVFANIPFRHTSAIVGKLTTGVAPPDDTWLVVQKEAAERYLPGHKMTMVALGLAPWFDVSIAHRFSRRDFRPAPSVDSVLLRLMRREQPLLALEHRERFTSLVESAFSAWQPTLAKALDARLPRKTAKLVRGMRGLDLSRRPTEVDLETWVAIYHMLNERNDDLVWETLQRSSDELRKQQSSLERPMRTRARGGKRR